jgi:hypothetical protein
MNSKQLQNKWHDILVSSLKSGNEKDKVVALDFLSQQDSLDLETCKELFPLVKDCILHPDTQSRYFARKARNHMLDCFPEVEPQVVSVKSMPLKIKEGETLSAEQILLHKLRLGSRYVVFEALERLTESQDSSIVSPLLEYLEEEEDEHKKSYVLKVLGRFDDHRIPDVLVTYLNHEDPRIVANSLESLCSYDVPYTLDRLIEFATSRDNRIRANAIMGLFRYDPTLAEQHIAEMMYSNNIANQASAIYLLKNLRPSNLSELLEAAHHSRYATVRIQALDIPPPNTEELEINELKKNEDIEKVNPKRDMFLMEVFVLIGAFVLLFSAGQARYLLSVAFLVFATTMLFMHEKARTSVQKMALSMGFVSSLAWGNTRLMVLPALMGLWLTWNGNIIKKDGKLEKARVESIFAWFFTLGAIIITQVVQNEVSGVLNLAGKLAEAGNAVPEAVAELVVRQQRFELMIFVFVSLMTIFIMKFNEWFPSRKKEGKPLKRLLIATIICLGLTLIVNLSHIFGVNVHIKVNSLDNILEVLKTLLP